MDSGQWTSGRERERGREKEREEKRKMNGQAGQACGTMGGDKDMTKDTQHKPEKQDG